MKKIVSIVLAMVMCVTMFALTGCEGGSKDDGKYTVGVCQLVQHPALDAATQGFIDTLKTELGEENVEILNENASNDPATCTTIVNNFVSKKVDASIH